MAYNKILEERIDFLITGETEYIKKRMFGGIAYLLNGNMCFGIHKEFLIIRTSKEKAEQIIKNSYASVFDITGRPMKGWTMIEADGIERDEQLLEFMQTAREFVLTLPAK